ncbi:hypothetical protein B484DRAFT_314830, partial [Ochromonadaceae sp. CCMP2298]
TACSTFSPRNDSATSFILRRIIALTSSGAMTFFSEPTTASTMGLSPVPCVTLKGSSLASFCTEGSENFRPMKRFTSNMVFSGLDA